MAFVVSVKVGEQTHFGTFDVESEDSAKSSLKSQLESDGVEVPKGAKFHVEGSVSPEVERLQNSHAQLEAEAEATAEHLESELAKSQEALDNAH